MSATVGDQVPDVEVHVLGDDGMPKPVRTTEVLGRGTVMLFAVPGAFTPGCSKIHLPGYVQHGGELKAKGVDQIVCVAVNDPWVMDAWARAQGADDIMMLSDGSAQFAAAMGLTMDGSAFGLGPRSQRYAALIKDGVIKELEVEPGPGVFGEHLRGDARQGERWIAGSGSEPGRGSPASGIVIRRFGCGVGTMAR